MAVLASGYLLRLWQDNGLPIPPKLQWVYECSYAAANKYFHYRVIWQLFFQLVYEISKNKCDVFKCFARLTAQSPNIVSLQWHETKKSIKSLWENLGPYHFLAIFTWKLLKLLYTVLTLVSILYGTGVSHHQRATFAWVFSSSSCPLFIFPFSFWPYFYSFECLHICLVIDLSLVNGPPLEVISSLQLCPVLSFAGLYPINLIISITSQAD